MLFPLPLTFIVIMSTEYAITNDGKPVALIWDSRPQSEDLSKAVTAGYDSNGHIYVARMVWGNLKPGKYNSGTRAAYFTLDGHEYFTHCGFHLLMNPIDIGVSWRRWCRFLSLPKKAIIGGRAPNGGPLFIGRTVHEGNNTVIGYIDPLGRILYYGWNEKEYSSRTFDILVAE